MQTVESKKKSENLDPLQDLMLNKTSSVSDVISIQRKPSAVNLRK